MFSPKSALYAVVLGVAFLSPTLQAISLFGSDGSYSLEIDGDASLGAILKDEIDRQRQNNLYLKELSAPNRIARYERQLLIERLHAEGFYDAEVNFELIETQTIYSVISGQVYRIKEIFFELPSGVQLPADFLSLQAGEPLRAEQILAAERSLNRYVSANHCLYEIDTKYEVIAETNTQTALITFSVANSPSVLFGEISFTGLDSIDPEYLEGLLPMHAGDCFKQSLIDAARLDLIQSNLLLGVTTNIGEVDNGKVPITFAAKERSHRTFSAGAGFQTDDGFGVSGGWEHRNLLGRGEQLQIDAIIAERFQNIASNFRVSQFLRTDQAIIFYTDLTRENTDAFESKSLDGGAELSRRFGNNLRASLGAEVEFSRVEADGETDDFALLSIPLGLEYDRRNDPLNPTRGWVTAVKTQPYWDGYDTSTLFIKSSFAASAYHSLDKMPLRPTFAIRAATGSIGGEDRDTIPANLRFYSGGGGSVRGYPFQTLGPIDDEGDPSGGLSFSEISIESRLRFTENWGAVVFLDGGFADENRTPSFNGDLLWGAGVGLRFYTSFAPIRFDVAVPLDRRDDVDDSFQIYIGIGQSF